MENILTSPVLRKCKIVILTFYQINKEQEQEEEEKREEEERDTFIMWEFGLFLSSILAKNNEFFEFSHYNVCHSTKPQLVTFFHKLKIS